MGNSIQIQINWVFQHQQQNEGKREGEREREQERNYRLKQT